MKVRIISAVIALAIFIPLLLLGGLSFKLGIILLSLLSLKEIFDLKKNNSYPLIIKILSIFSLLSIILNDKEDCIILPLLLMLLPVVLYKKDRYLTKDAFSLLGFIYLIGLFYRYVLIIRNVNLNIIIYLLSITIITDTFAYIGGSLIGKHKLCQNISPHKTWEGAICGTVSGTIISTITYCNLISSFNIKILVVTFLLTIIGQFGDLVYSKIKRENNIKDFSNIMPGHGGILDRLDSFSFVVIAYILIVSLF